MMITGVFCFRAAFPHVGIFFSLVGKIFQPDFRQIAAIQLVNLIKKNNIRVPPTPTEAVLVGIAH